MAVYFCVSIKVKEEAEYAKYLAGVEGLVARYGGRYLAVDTSPVQIEGNWPFGRAVLIRFPDQTTFRRWYESSEYQAVLGFRLGAADGVAILVHGEDEEDGLGVIAQGRRFLRSNWELLDHYESDQNKGLPVPPQEASAESPTIRLTKAENFSFAGPPLLEAFRSRKSRRKYTRAELSFEELSFLAWAAQGVKEAKPKYSLRTVPSGGARHPMDLYLFTARVRGLEPGLYRYLPIEHSLALVRGGDDSKALDEALLGQYWGAAAVFIWTAVPYRTEWRYGPVSHKIVALDAGHSCQNLYIACEAVSCGTCAIGAYDQEKLDAYLGLDGKESFTIYAAPVGKV
jgi:SagB-type dehydrogenase family enzyme